MVSCWHATWQPVPVTKSAVHDLPSSQFVGQLPGLSGAMPRSHASPSSRTPLPQKTGQSVSVAFVAPVGQQPSLALYDGVTLGKRRQTAEHVPAEISMAASHDLGGALQSSAVGHDPGAPPWMRRSQVSPG